MSLFERMFQLQQHGTTVRTELLAGITTFLTMSYIVFVNPEILGTTGMDAGAVFVATRLAAALGSAVMALAANFPVGMAPGMGLNAFFAFTVVGAAGLPWQQALGAVFISGLVFLVLSLTGVRHGWCRAFLRRCARRSWPASACSWRSSHCRNPA